MINKSYNNFVKHSKISRWFPSSITSNNLRAEIRNTKNHFCYKFLAINKQSHNLSRKTLHTNYLYIPARSITDFKSRLRAQKHSESTNIAEIELHRIDPMTVCAIVSIVIACEMISNEHAALMWRETRNVHQL